MNPETSPGPRAAVRRPDPPPPRRTVRVLFSFVALILAPLSWWISIDDPLLRASGMTAWMLFSAALYLSLSAAWVDRRPWVRLVALGQLGALGLGLWMFFGLSRLPDSSLSGLERAPDFVLPDQEGRSVRLAEELTRGPVLLVFTRGHW